MRRGDHRARHGPNQPAFERPVRRIGRTLRQMYLYTVRNVKEATGARARLPHDVVTLRVAGGHLSPYRVSGSGDVNCQSLDRRGGER